jgi:hypothetical protein
LIKVNADFQSFSMRRQHDMRNLVHKGLPILGLRLDKGNDERYSMFDDPEGSVMGDGIERKRNLLAEAMQCYFFELCPALVARCQVVIIGLPPLALQEIARRLQTLTTVSNETNRELGAARVAASTREASTEQLLDRALASVDHLREVAEAIMRRLDALMNPIAYTSINPLN